ncbi:YgiT-type zinc finger domain protein (plasmid) [Clostridium baratii str. Sullivan]|uniref:YgiT-type zinc finger domain protein n=1 Tax=Clostridium baratii str. Sullivan TaxID=1415775 RepID=A0A0A7G0F9_9CLOT|nr:hypothetical protein [Clostridium baratii]AIY85323.1 YgiT-type zinc finger domain protein [Clostridium baratii str. Sullivan]
MLVCENCNRIMNLVKRREDDSTYICNHCGTICTSPKLGKNDIAENNWFNKDGALLTKEEMHGTLCKHCGKIMISEEYFLHPVYCIDILYCKHCNVYVKKFMDDPYEDAQYTWIDEETRIKQLLSREESYTEKLNLLNSLVQSSQRFNEIIEKELKNLKDSVFKNFIKDKLSLDNDMLKILYDTEE